MDCVLTLISDPAAPTLDNSMTSAASSALQEGAADVAEADWLAPGIACDVRFVSRNGTADLAPLRAEIRRRLDSAAVDVVLQPAGTRRKALLVADMESTIIRNEMLNELAVHIGAGERVAEITARAMNGEIDFAAALRERVALLEGLPLDRIDEAARHIEFSPGAGELVATMRANKAHTVLLSGGFTVFTRPVAKAIGFDSDVANILEVAGDKLTGSVVEPILGTRGKLNTLRRVAQVRGLEVGQALAVGDGANDLPMLKAAGMGVAYHAKPTVARGVETRIDHGDLTALLYLQGYRMTDFVVPEPANR